ncbi:uncharacterized protein LOC141691174 [Apium graveolens]|uniref:uncharacterized protein LOC141691174 n=1 Tax=Apium graveolens TaxID=4045 RepID=UPI003D7BAEC8
MDGWQHARPVISIDGTFLKGRYRGKLLISMDVDSNNHPFPLCYGLVDEETYENWSWFLQRLRRHVYHHHPGGELKKLMWKTGRTTQVSKHDAYMSRIGEISPTALQYLATIPVERWTLSHDSGVRYGQTITNMLERFNDNIRRACFILVTAMMEYLFYKTVTIVDKYRNIVDDGLQEGRQLCERSASMLAKIRRKETGHTVITFHHLHGIMKILTHQYTTAKGKVKGGKTQVVNLNDHTCTCGKWATHHMLCSHAMEGCITHGLSWEHLIKNFYKNQTMQDLYMPIIYPLEPTQYWNYDLPVPWQGYGKLVPEESLKKLKKKRRDKGQSVRIRMEIDGPRSGKKCSVCNQEGHTKRSKKCLGRPH